MKQLKFFFLIIVLSSFSNIAISQDQSAIHLRFGILKHIPHNVPAVLKNSRASSSNTFELILERKLKINDNYSINGGLGFSVYRFLDSNIFFDGNTRQSNYGILKYGLSRRICTEKLFLNFDIFHYILAYKEKQYDNQRRAFTNVEIGLTYKINDRFSISMSSPLTLYPMFLLRLGTGVLGETITRYYSNVRNYGLNASVSYNF